MICLGVADLEASKKFYHEGLGFPKLDSVPGTAYFDLDGTWLHLRSREDLAADAGVSAEGSGYNALTLYHTVKSVEEVSEVLKKAVDAGAKEIKAPQQASWGGYHAFFQDPDGNVWEIAFSPFAWVGPVDKEE